LLNLKAPYFIYLGKLSKYFTGLAESKLDGAGLPLSLGVPSTEYVSCKVDVENSGVEGVIPFKLDKFEPPCVCNLSKSPIVIVLL
tara:strand:- start:310 stop:564 length:255 start_codon:yes stop_codon:yes gene_type:complete